MPRLVKVLMCGTLVAALGGALALAQGARAYKPGQKLPDLTYLDLAGRVHKLSEHRGKVVLLSFFAYG